MVRKFYFKHLIFGKDWNICSLKYIIYLKNVYKQKYIKILMLFVLELKRKDEMGINFM